MICHPHPLYGGDMDNPVVVRVAEVCNELGLATLRFNFRGVGASTGHHGHGRDERHDVAAALAHLASVLPTGAPLGLVGYSFGAAMAANLASEPADFPPLTAMALIAPPLVMTGDEPFTAVARLADKADFLGIAGNKFRSATPSYFEELARRLYRRHENKLVRQERWGLPEGGLISTNRDEVAQA